MKRPTVAALIGAALIASILPALAQVVPGDTGAGQERGLQALNNSGEVGTVTLFNRGAKTTVVLNIKSAPGHPQPAHIHRGKACDSTVDPNPAYALSNVVDGRSVTVVPAPEAKLLSGNYVVVVHQSPKNIARYVACGQLYQ